MCSSDLLNAVQSGQHKQAKKTECAPLRDQITAWLKRFSKQVGDRMPAEEVIVLPYRELNAIYTEYADDMKTIGEPVASQSLVGQISLVKF